MVNRVKQAGSKHQTLSLPPDLQETHESLNVQVALYREIVYDSVRLAQLGKKDEPYKFEESYSCAKCLLRKSKQE